MLFLDFTGVWHEWFGWMAKVQFVPALLALNVAVVVGLVVLTLLFGRVYCSVICPLGVFQDVVSRMGGRFKKNRFRYSPALSWLRWPVLLVFIVFSVAGLISWAGLVEPYSAYGRMASNLLAPFTVGETMLWPTLPSGRTAMLSMRPTCGSGAGPRWWWPCSRWRCWWCWPGATGARIATWFAPWARCWASCRATHGSGRSSTLRSASTATFASAIASRRASTSRSTR